MYLDLDRERKQNLNMKVSVISVEIGALDTANKGLLKGLGGLGNKRTSGEHANYGIKIG